MLISSDFLVLLGLFATISFLFYIFAFRIKVREILDALLTPIAKKIPSRITPNHISIAGFCIFLAAALFLYLVKYNYLFSIAFAAFIVLYGISDGLDGILARSRNQVSKSGIFLDQTTGKIGEIVILSAIIAGGYVNAGLIVIIMVCRLFYSYINMQSLALTGGKFSRPDSSRWFVLTIAFAVILFIIKFLDLEIVDVFGKNIRSLDALFVIISIYYLGITFYRTVLLWRKLKQVDRAEGKF